MLDEVSSYRVSGARGVVSMYIPEEVLVLLWKQIGSNGTSTVLEINAGTEGRDWLSSHQSKGCTEGFGL